MVSAHHLTKSGKCLPHFKQLTAAKSSDHFKVLMSVPESSTPFKDMRMKQNFLSTNIFKNIVHFL